MSPSDESVLGVSLLEESKEFGGKIGDFCKELAFLGFQMLLEPFLTWSDGMVGYIVALWLEKKKMNTTEIPKILYLEILFAVDSSSDFVTDFIIQQQIDILISLLFQDEHKKQNFNSILHHAL